MSIVARVDFVDYCSSVERALDIIDAAELLPQNSPIVLKPNLTNADAPPVTTPVACVEAVLKYCKAHSMAEIIIAEGCGSGTTDQSYKANGYVKLAEKYDVKLVDLNKSESVVVERDDAVFLKEFHMPVVIQDAFVISIPILKDHCFTDTTIALKNMFGIAPAPFYKGNWNKSKLHTPSTHRHVVDLNLYKKPSISVVDAVVALTGMHLSGTPVEHNVILASTDPVAVDAVGSEMLEHDPFEIEYLVSANGLLGSMDDIDLRS